MVSKPDVLLSTPRESFTFYVLVSDNFAGNPGEKIQKVKVTVIQPNRPPVVTSDPPSLYLVENETVGATVSTRSGITSLLNSAFVDDAENDELTVEMDSCSTETFCKAFNVAPDGVVTVKNDMYLNEETSPQVPRFLRVKFKDGIAEPTPAFIPVTVKQIRLRGSRGRVRCIFFVVL